MAATKKTISRAPGSEILGSALAPRFDRATLVPKLKIAAVAFAVFWAFVSCTTTVFGGGDAPDPAASNPNLSQADLVGSLAVDFVKDYFESSQGTPRDLTPYITVRDDRQLPASPQQFTDAKIAFRKPRVVVDETLALWTVVVKGRLNATSSATTPLTYYQVPIALHNGVARAVTFPRQVAAPELGVDVTLGYQAAVGNDAAIAQVAMGFLRAYLTNDAGIDRFTAADSGLKPIENHPFDSVAFAKNAVKADNETGDNEGSVVGIYVEAFARTKLGAQIQMPYTMTLKFTAGRWQVTGLDDIPVVSTDTSDPGTSNSESATTTATAPPARRDN